MKYIKKIHIGLLFTAVLFCMTTGCAPYGEQELQQSVQIAGSAEQTQQMLSLDGKQFIQPLAIISMNTPDNEQALESRYGLTISAINELVENTEKSVQNQVQFTISNGTSEDSVSADGTITVNGEQDDFQLTGQLTCVELDNQDICFAGGLSGYLNEESTPENAVTLSLNYDATSEECYIMMQIGSSMCLDFGTPFAGITEIQQNLYK